MSEQRSQIADRAAIGKVVSRQYGKGRGESGTIDFQLWIMNCGFTVPEFRSQIRDGEKMQEAFS
jgi:hypothetical protein